MERLDAKGWSPAWQLLGLPTPPLPPAQDLRQAHLLRVREQTHYQFTRNAVKLLAGAVIALVSVAGLLVAVPTVVALIAGRCACARQAGVSNRSTSRTNLSNELQRRASSRSNTAANAGWSRVSL